MTSYRVPLIAAAGLLVFVAIVTNAKRAVAQNPHPGSAPVNIVSPVPLPITGDVSITGTPTINISNTASTPLYVNDIDAAARQPFQVTLCRAGGLFRCSGSGPTVPTSFTLPTGRQAVVEYVSGFCATGATSPLLVQIATTVGGTSVNHVVPSLSVGDLQQFGNQTRIYADQGSNVSLSLLSEGGPDNSFICRAAVSGYTSP